MVHTQTNVTLKACNVKTQLILGILNCSKHISSVREHSSRQASCLGCYESWYCEDD